MLTGDGAAATGSLAVRERVHLHDVVPPGPHQLRQHRERETLPLLVYFNILPL